MEHSQPLAHSFPWRTATLVVGAIAAIELVALGLVGGARLAHLVRPARHVPARVATTQAPPRQAVARTPTRHVAVPPAHPLLPRSRVSVLVLNGNGVAGAAAAEAARIRTRGYVVPTATNAPRHDYARSMVLFKPGFAAEARRLGRDAGVGIVSPLDGMPAAELKGSQLVVVLGGS